MKYYLLRFSDDLREVGKQPQAPDIKLIGYNTEDLGFEGPIQIPLTPPQPILQAKGKPTTILNVVAINFLIYIVCKQYFISYLDEFDIGDFNSWPMKVHYKNRILTDYRLFHLSYPSDKKYVDYKKSQFLIGKIGDWRDMSKRKTLEIADYNNYVNLREVIVGDNDNSEIKHHKIVLNLSNATEDLFRIEMPPARGYYVSERLKNAIEEQRFTGMDFKEIEEYNNRIEVRYTNQGTIP